MHRNLSRALSCLIAAGAIACRGATDPQPDRCLGSTATSAQATHPAGTLLTRASNLAGRPFGIRVSACGVVAVTQQDNNSIAQFKLADLIIAPFITVGADPGDVVFTRDGKTAYVSNFNEGTVHVIDVATRQQVRLLLVDARNAYRLALAPDDSRLYVTTMDGRLYAVDPAGIAATTSIALAPSLQGIALSRDGSTLLVSAANGGVWRVNARTLTVIASSSLNALSTQEVALGPDESELYVANETGYVDVLSASTLQPIRRISLPSLRPFGLAVTPDGAQIYIASPGTGQIGILDRSTGTVRQIVAVGGVPRRIAFDAVGSTAVVSNEGNWVDVIR